MTPLTRQDRFAGRSRSTSRTPSHSTSSRGNSAKGIPSWWMRTEKPLFPFEKRGSGCRFAGALTKGGGKGKFKQKQRLKWAQCERILGSYFPRPGQTEHIPPGFRETSRRVPSHTVGHGSGIPLRRSHRGGDLRGDLRGGGRPFRAGRRGEQP